MLAVFFCPCSVGFMVPDLPAIAPSSAPLLTREDFHVLAAIPPEVEWFADIQNPNTRAAYRSDVSQFMAFVGLQRAEEFRMVARAHVIAWRKQLAAQKLAAASIRRKLSAVGSLFRYLCEQNAIIHNPCDGVSRPKEGANEGKTPALSDAQARALLEAPDVSTGRGLRDRAMLAVLLYHGLRASELCALRVGDFAERRGFRSFMVQGKGGKIRYIPAHPKAVAAVDAYLETCDHRAELSAPLFVSSRRASASGPKGMTRARIRELIARHAGVAHLHPAMSRPHALRATAATNALEHGADIALVQDWLGHANPATTRLYDKRGQKPEESPSYRVSY